MWWIIGCSILAFFLGCAFVIAVANSAGPKF